MNPWLRLLTVLTGLAIGFALAVLAVVTGAHYFFRPDLPSADALRDVQLQIPLRVYSRDGRLMAQIGEKRRIPAAYDDIPPRVVQAFLAAEDDRFFDHPGFDYQGIIRAAVNLAVTGSRSQGGSTITQQLARVYFLTPDRTFARKAKELLLATQIEREFTKQEILALYLNKIFLGQRAYGVAAAAEVYFGKTLEELSVAETATIAGLPKAPSSLNPVSNPLRATERRAYVLRRMLDLDFIDTADYELAIATPMVSRLHGPSVELEAPYVAEMVRAEMIARFGPEAYTAGYEAVTTVDSRLQAAADLALRRALLEYDRRHGYRGPEGRHALADIPADPAGPGGYDITELAAMLASLPRYGNLYAAVVLSLGDDDSAEVFIRDRGTATIPWQNLDWRAYVNDNAVGPAPKSVADMVSPGDLIRLTYTDDQGWVLTQLPAVQGALVALSPEDGSIVALSGGFDFSSSKFNRAVQTRRQPGSSFKPFVYSAALENGFTTATLVNDAPVVFDDANLETTWRPENYSRQFYGPTRLREALVRSLNLVSVRVLLGSGIDNTVRHIRSFGVPDSALPRDSSLALGSGGAAPLDMAAGYAVFASGGYRVAPYVMERVVDTTGKEVFTSSPAVVCRECELSAAERTALEVQQAVEREPAPRAPLTVVPEDQARNFDAEVPNYRDVEQMSAHGLAWRPTAEDAPAFVRRYENPAPRVISATNAYIVYDMMRDVIRRGTGRGARELGRSDIAGKTGTTNERRDAWFSGFNGDLVATAWVGFDQERPLGNREEGGRTALPMWKYFMAEALADASDATIRRPPGIVTVRIDPESGLVAPAGSPGAIFEIFEAGKVPEMLAAEPDPVFSGTDPMQERSDEPLF
ncbi:MAG: penicillin-binding protein 1A [Chromatiales bacterium]|nr:MAG: penicillin-binding protein 1A [Chromatiales bacterium]